MNCKNCNDRLRLDFMYCPGCGAKVVKKRLTFKGLFADIAERLFNLENSFYRTLRDMTVRPEAVVLKYVEGTRRRYMSPMNYLALALGLSGIILVFMRKYALDKINFDAFGPGMNADAGEKIMNAAMEYNSFIFILYIPVMAMAGWLTMNRREHNIPEHTVTSTYILSHISFLTFPISLLVLFVAPDAYMQYSLWYVLFMVVFTIFVLARTHNYKGWAVVGRGLLFFLIFIFGYFAISIVLNIIFFLTGILELKDFLPPDPEAQAGVSSAMNWASYNLW